MHIPPLQKQLLCLLADGKFHPGASLAQATGLLNRGAVWKHLQALSVYGLRIRAITGKGYRLHPPLQLLELERIQTLLGPPAKRDLRIEIFDALDSTNSQLMRQAEPDTPGGLTYLSEYQTAGRGRRGRQWTSPFGQNIYLSMLWRYPDGPAAIAGLSLAAGVAVTQALHDIGATEIDLKWPNDIQHRGKKLGGILVEVSGETNGPCHAVAGVGLNLQLTAEQAAGIDQPWTDLSRILGAEAYLSRNRLAAALLNRLHGAMSEFSAARLPETLNAWRQYDCLLGLPVQLQIGEQRLQGIAAGIDDHGLLLLEQADGQRRAYASGEVSVRAL